MLTTEELLTALDRDKTVPADVRAKLWQTVRNAPGQLDSRGVVQWLVDNGFLDGERGVQLLTGIPELGEEDLLLDDLDVGGGSPPARPAAPSRPLADTVTGPTSIPGDEDLLLSSSEGAAPPSPASDTPKSKRPRVPASVPSWSDETKTGIRRSSSASIPQLDNLLDDPLFGQIPPPQAPTFPGRQPLFGGAPLDQPVAKKTGWQPKDEANKKPGWDSPLILLGGGGLLALVILAGALIWLLNHESADKALEAAEADYKNGAYATSIEKYNHYIQNHSTHAGISHARVRRGLAQLRVKMASSRDAADALAMAKEVLPDISKEAQFEEARAELADLLPAIASGLALNAHDKPDPKTVALAREALGLVDRYVPKQLRPVQKLSDIAASLDLTERTLERDTRLEKTITTMDAAAKSGDATAAYRARMDLLRDYPDLSTSEPLAKALLHVSQSQQGRVAFTQEGPAAQTTEAPSGVQASIAAARTSGGSVDSKHGIALVLAEGGAYGLDADNGKLLWRRFVGVDTDFVPAHMGSDALLVGSQPAQVVRVDAATGALRWRQPLDGPVDPLVIGQQIIVGSADGQVRWIDAASGKVKQSVTIPQPVHVPLAVAEREQKAYVVADNSNVYVLDLAAHSCSEVLYLGHEAGTVPVAPLAIGGYVIVVENQLARNSRLTVLKTGEQGEHLAVAQRVPLEGHVHVPLMVSDRMLFVSTDRGALEGYEINPPGGADPLTAVAEKPAEDADPLVRYPLLSGAQLFVAGNSLTRFDVQAARGRLQPKWVAHDGNVFLQAPQQYAAALVSVRRRKGEAGVAVSAVNPDDGKPIWETVLAEPPAGEAAAAGGKVSAITVGGSLIVAAADGLNGPGIVSAPASESIQQNSAANAAVIDDHRIVYGAPGARGVWIVDLASKSNVRRVLTADVLAAAPIAFRNGFVVAGEHGAVQWLNADDGRALAQPFQPRLESTAPANYVAMTAVGKEQFAFSDGRCRLYVVGVSDQPEPNLAALGQATLRAPLTTLAATESSLVGVNVQGRLESFMLPDLKAGPKMPADRVVWGPFAHGKQVVFATAAGELVSLGADLAESWRVHLPATALVGQPLWNEQELCIAALAGKVFRVAAASGEVLATLDAAQPLAAGPALLQDRLLLVGHDGALLVVAPMSAAQSASNQAAASPAARFASGSGG